MKVFDQLYVGNLLNDHYQINPKRQEQTARSWNTSREERRGHARHVPANVMQLNCKERGQAALPAAIANDRKGSTRYSY
eukprot:858284-Amphidinium_carterae.1